MTSPVWRMGHIGLVGLRFGLVLGCMLPIPIPIVVPDCGMSTVIEVIYDLI